MKLNQTKSNNYINHVIFCLDKSGSIANAGLTESIVDIYNKQIKVLRERSEELNQTTRVSVYFFNHEVECICFEADIDSAPSINRLYQPNGDTALIDAALTVINDVRGINMKYGDNSVLCYFLTDGANRINNSLSTELRKQILTLPENWTFAALVPDFSAVHEAKKFGFPAGNIQVWETTKKGAKQASETLNYATSSYLSARSKGSVGTKSLFQLKTDNLSKRVIKNELEELSPKEYRLFPVHNQSQIKPFVESWTGEDYRISSAYYQISKPETIQPYKNICIQDKLNGKVYSGVCARKLLGLPDYTVKVSPGVFNNFDIFVQSSSTNRILVAGTKLLVIN